MTTTIDLRSDTVTKPSPAMRRAMADAPVGDDVYGEDPSVNRLEALAADVLGKEAAMYVPSGTMGNLSCILTHCGRGAEYIVGDSNHTYLYEAGGSAVLGGVHPRVIPNREDGTLEPEAIVAAVNLDDEHFARTRLISLENTHNRKGGRVLPLDYTRTVREIADEHGLALHCDGARLWNAAIALGASPATLAESFDSLSVCLSKGLAAPVGSLVVGSRAFVAEARRVRKVLGGGMRQAGIIAAAGIVALTEMIERLADDHENAQRFADGITALGYRVTHPVETNLVIFEAPDGSAPEEHVASWRERGLLINAIGGDRFRAVTHYGIEPAHVARAVAIMDEELNT